MEISFNAEILNVNNSEDIIFQLIQNGTDRKKGHTIRVKEVVFDTFTASQLHNGIQLIDVDFLFL